MVACSSPVREAEQVIRRSFGKVPENLRLKLNEAPDQQYSLEVKEGTLYLEGSSPVALCKGFHDYILSEGYGVSNWSGNRLEFPQMLPDMDKQIVVSPFDNHLFYNVCTFGYTTPFWGWEQWEKEIDWLALHGFDMPLSPIGTEAILSRVWKSIGLSQEEIDVFFTGPAHFPWNPKDSEGKDIPFTEEPPVWFHDLFHVDGTPWNPDEVLFIRSLTEKNKP